MVRDGIAVIIPCYNEALTIGKVVDDFHRELPEATVYVYDNASTDATAAIAMRHGATVRYEPRRGKGNVIPEMVGPPSRDAARRPVRFPNGKPGHFLCRLVGVSLPEPVFLRIDLAAWAICGGVFS